MSQGAVLSVVSGVILKPKVLQKPLKSTLRAYTGDKLLKHLRGDDVADVGRLRWVHEVPRAHESL